MCCELEGTRMSVLTFLQSSDLRYTVGIPFSVLLGVMLFGIGVTITAPPRSETIRRHGTRIGRWQLPAEYVDHTEGVLHAHEPRHLDDDAPSGEHTGTLSIMEPRSEEIMSWPQVGRRGLESIVRHTTVTENWCPYIGDPRVALLETRTAEYLFARRPKDQLDTGRTQFIRSFSYSG